MTVTFVLGFSVREGWEMRRGLAFEANVKKIQVGMGLDVVESLLEQRATRGSLDNMDKDCPQAEVQYFFKAPFNLFHFRIEDRLIIAFDRDKRVCSISRHSL